MKTEEQIREQLNLARNIILQELENGNSYPVELVGIAKGIGRFASWVLKDGEDVNLLEQAIEEYKEA